MSIQKLRGNKYEPQRAYLWDLRIKGPLVFPSPESTKFLAQSLNIPSKSVELISVPFQGGNKNYAGMDSSEKTFTVTFFDDEEGEIVNHFRKWMFLIRNQVLRGGVDRLLYVAMVEAHLKNVKNDKTTTMYQFQDAYPISMGEVSLDYSSNEFVSVPITFAYRLRQEQFDV